MADLISIDDIEAALGRPAEDAEEEALWAFYISVVSDYINEYVSVSFFLVEDEVKRFKASYSGEIQLVGPVHQVTDVVNFRTLMTCWWADWDGMNTIFGLEPQEVVDVTYTYGYEAVPADIVNLATSAVVRLAGGQETSVDLRSHQVGDVRDEYRDNGVAELLGSYGSTVLAKYADDTFTIDVSGSGRYPNYMSNQIPTPDPAAGLGAPTLTDVTPVEGDEGTPFAITFAGENWVEGIKLFLDGVEVGAVFDIDAGTGSAFLYSVADGTQDLTVVNEDEQASDPVEITFNDVPPPAPTQVSIWTHTKRPAGGASSSGLPAVLGTKFSSDSDGQVIEVSYYKSAGQLASEKMYIFTDVGVQLEEITMDPMDTGTEGWHTTTLPTPLAITAGISYVVTYFTSDTNVWTGSLYLSVEREEDVVRAPANGGYFDLSGLPDAFPTFTAGDCYFADVLVELD